MESEQKDYISAKTLPILSYGYKIEGTYDSIDITVDVQYQDSFTISVSLTSKEGRSFPLNQNIGFILFAKSYQHKVTFTPESVAEQEIITRIINLPFNLDELGIGKQKIPRSIYQTFKSSSVPIRVKKRIETWLQNNPEYEYHYYCDSRCDEFLAKEFSGRVYKAYQKLIPGAFKADLWRYCILYKRGGVYVDIPMADRIPLREIIRSDTDFLVPRDTPSNKSYLYNAFMASVANSQVLSKAIDICVENIEGNWYGTPRDSICITGPGVLGKALNLILSRPDKTDFLLGNYRLGTLQVNILEHLPNRILEKEEDYKTFQEKPLQLTNRGGVLLLNPPCPLNTIGSKLLVQTKYPEYYEDRKPTGPHYWYFYSSRQVYKQYIPSHVSPKVNDNGPCGKIPKIIYQTFEDNGVTQNMWNASNSWYNINKEFDYHFYNENNRREFIVKSFGDRVLSAYDLLVPGAYKADLWKYCILYVYGGVYADIDSTCRLPLEIDTGTDCMFCIDTNPLQLKSSILATYPNNSIILGVIAYILQNVEGRNYGYRDTEVTGSSILSKIVRESIGLPKDRYFTEGTFQVENNSLTIDFWKFNQFDNTVTHQGSSRKIIQNKYAGYDEERLVLGGSDWAQKWRDRQVYKDKSSKLCL